MTTAQQIRSTAVSENREVSIAGVPWPLYKVVALVAGFAALLIVGVVTMTAAPSVLAGAAVGSAVWLALGVAQRRRR